MPRGVLAPECQWRFGIEQLVRLFIGQQGLGTVLDIGQDAVGVCRIRGVLIAPVGGQGVVLGARQDHDVVALWGLRHDGHMPLSYS